MKLRDLMSQDVISVSPEAPLKEAARRMLEAHVSGLPVTDEDGKLVGVITEADFVKTEADRRSRARAGLLRWFVRDSEITDTARTVGDAMTTHVLTLGSESDHTEAARLMRNEGIKRIPIVDEAGHVRGIVSRSDIMRALARPDAEVLNEIETRVIKEIMWLDPSSVEVRCVDGDVTLRGRLDTRSETQMLLEFVRRVDGVTSVRDGLSWEFDDRSIPHPERVI